MPEAIIWPIASRMLHGISSAFLSSRSSKSRSHSSRITIHDLSERLGGLPRVNPQTCTMYGCFREDSTWLSVVVVDQI